jgi:DNA polymerase I-like protein with 3'-5' exonuclease and polymerase domains
MTDNINYSPHDQLPAPEPSTIDYKVDHFYTNTAKYLIKDAIRIMDNGLSIDLNKVIELEEVLETQLQEIEKELESNPLIVQYLEHKHSSEIAQYKKARQQKLRSYTDYVTPFNHKDMTHRSYFMEIYGQTKGWSKPEEKLPTGVSKWPLKLVKQYAKVNQVIAMLVNGALPANTHAAVAAMEQLAKDKAKLYNCKYLEQMVNPEVPLPKFNPASSKQKQELFKMLGIESEAVSKTTGLPTWSRDQIERVNKETDVESIKALTQCFIDHSFAAIIKNNFIEAFYNYTVNNRLYGQYKLLGAKTGRFTSSNP